MESAAAAWPDDDVWEVIGADDYAEPSNDDVAEGDDTDIFDSPAVYGEFSTVTNPETPGWMG